MGLRIECQNADGITTLNLTGELTLGAGHLQLRRRIVSLLRGGNNKIIVNFERVTKIDEAGTGILELALARSQSGGGKVVLLKLDKSKIDSPHALDLDERFEAYQDGQDAINSFFPDRAIKHYDILTFVEQQLDPSKTETKS